MAQLNMSPEIRISRFVNGFGSKYLHNNNIQHIYGRESPNKGVQVRPHQPITCLPLQLRAHTLNMSRKSLRFHRSIPHRDSLPLRLHQLNRPRPLLCNLVTDGNNRLVRAIDIEVRIQILKSPLHGFWVEEVDDREEHEIEGCENDVKAVSDVFDAGRGELRADEAEEPVGGCCGCGAPGTHGEGVDFGLVDPRDHAPCAEGMSAIRKIY